MEAPTCPVCHQYTTGVVQFADYQPLPQGSIGLPTGYVYFCPAHLQVARQFSHLPSYQAIPMLMQYQQQQQPMSGGIPHGTVVFEHQKGRMGCLLVVAVFFAVLPLLGILMLSGDITRGLFRGRIEFGPLAFLLLMLSVTALFGHLGYRAFKQSRNQNPRLTLDSEGFVDLFLSDKPIYWRDITDMKFIQGRMRHAGLISKIKLSLSENSEFKRNASILKKGFNRIQYMGYDVEVDVSRLEKPGSYIFAQFEDFYTRFGPRR